MGILSSVCCYKSEAVEALARNDLEKLEEKIVKKLKLKYYHFTNKQLERELAKEFEEKYCENYAVFDDEK